MWHIAACDKLSHVILPALAPDLTEKVSSSRQNIFPVYPALRISLAVDCLKHCSSISAYLSCLEGRRQVCPRRRNKQRKNLTTLLIRDSTRIQKNEQVEENAAFHGLVDIHKTVMLYFYPCWFLLCGVRSGFSLSAYWSCFLLRFQSQSFLPTGK